MRRRGKRPNRRKNTPPGDGARIDQRPEVIEQRLRLGDFEGDTVLGPPGTDGVATLVDRKTKAKARLMRVEELWAHVVELCNRLPEEDDFRALVAPEAKKEPVWGGALWIAKELAAGKVQMVVEQHDGENEAAYAAKINHLASTYPCIVFVPDDREAFGAGTNFMRRSADHPLRQIGKRKRVSEIVEATGVSRTTVFRTLERLYFKPKKKNAPAS